MYFLQVAALLVLADFSGISGRSLRPTSDEIHDKWLDGCGTRYSGKNSRRHTESLREKHKIVGGEEAQPGEFPWMVMLGDAERFPFCGGVLLDEHWVLTAAHCFDGYSGEVCAYAGEHVISEADNQNRQNQCMSMEDVFTHPLYVDEPEVYDIALIRTPDPFLINANVTPACAPDPQADVTGVLCTISGWGKRQETGAPSNILRHVDVPVIAHDECVQLLADSSRGFHDTNLCAGYTEGGKDACTGDSGGPMVCELEPGRFEVYGIIVWGDGCAQPNKPGVYTRVQSFLDWIDGTMAQLQQ